MKLSLVMTLNLWVKGSPSISTESMFSALIIPFYQALFACSAYWLKSKVTRVMT